MASLLLDHPWRLADVLSPRSEGFEVLETFDEFLKRTEGLMPIAFVALDDYENLCDLINEDPEMVAAATSFKILVEPYVRWTQDEAQSMASPHPEPNGIVLPQSWRVALGAAINNQQDWRNPQIVACSKNAARWPNVAEIPIRIGNIETSRVFTIVERYAEHRFAIPDFDPWDLRKYDPVPLGHRHPCRLPKPRGIDVSSMQRLLESLQRIRQRGWQYGGRYYYLPPASWDPIPVEKAQWRNGRAFPQQQGPGFKGPRIVDYEDRVWVWDHTETQWDVQHGASFYRIGELGNLLPRSPLA